MENYEASPDASEYTSKKEQHICYHMKLIAQDFEQKLFTTEEALALNKCFWYLISWNWIEDGSKKMKTLEESPGNIFLTQGYERENPKKITRKEINKSEHTLGVRITPCRT